MKKTSHIVCIAGALAALLASFGTQVLAQGQMPRQMPGTGMMDKGMMGMMRMMADCPMMDGDMAVHAEGRIAFLKAELGITDAQKVVWDAYAAAIAKNLLGMQATRQIMMKTMATTSPVERLENHIAAMEGRMSALKEIKPALGNLYGSLGDEQKRKADQLLTGMGCMM